MTCSVIKLCLDNGGSGGTQVLPEDFAAARSRARPSALREVAVELPDTRWSDVGGLHDIKERLKARPRCSPRKASLFVRFCQVSACMAVIASKS